MGVLDTSTRVVLNPQNWLRELRRDILERGTLHPEGEGGGGGPGGGLPEAPTNGRLHARQNSAWAAIDARNIPMNFTASPPIYITVPITSLTAIVGDNSVYSSLILKLTGEGFM